MRMRKKKNLLPRMEACGALLIEDPRALRGRWRELLPEARELRVELGCGKGRFTAETAAAEPDVLLIAVEKVPDAMVVAMERARDAGLHNVFFVDGDAACLPDFFAPGEVDRIYINFCDPWPKSNQKKRRLTHGNFLQLYRRVLPMVGEIHFKSANAKTTRPNSISRESPSTGVWPPWSPGRPLHSRRSRKKRNPGEEDRRT